MLLTRVLLLIISSSLFAPLVFCHPPAGQNQSPPEQMTPSRDGNQFRAIRGQVTDEAENPLPDYVIEAISIPDDGVTYAVKTDQSGKFALTNIHEGVWLLLVKYYSTIIEQRKITLAKDVESEVNFTIKGTGSVSGFLLDSVSRSPLPIDGDVYLGLLTEWEAVESVFRGQASGGSFEIKNLLPGQYVLIDAFPGYVLDMPEALEVTVYPDESIGGVELFLRPGALVRGKIVDTNGQPIPGVTVKVTSVKLRALRTKLDFIGRMQTGEDGKFSTTTPNDPGRYRSFSVMVTHPRYQAQLIHTDLKRGESEYQLSEIVMQETLVLTGKVLDAGGSSIERLKVILRRHNKPVDFFAFDARSEMEVYTDAKGNYLFEELYPTEYSLSVSRNGVTRYFLESVDPQRQSHLKIRLGKTQTLRGHVMDADDQPLEGVRVEARMGMQTPGVPSTLLASCQTDQDGAFRLEVLKVPPARLTVRISKPGYLSKGYGNVHITKAELPVLLDRGISLKGHVFTPPHLPLNGNYTIKLFPADVPMDAIVHRWFTPRPLITRRFPSTETEFSIDGLPRKEYALYVVSDKIAARGTTVDLTSGDGEVTLFVEGPSVALRGQVLWADTGRPVSEASVGRSWYPWELEIYDNSSSVRRFEVETDEDGKFEFLNLTPGRYILFIGYSDVSFETDSGSPERKIIHKRIELTVGNSGEPYIFYLGRRDGSSFVNETAPKSVER